MEVIVTVEGPSVPLTVRRKSRRAGIWINTDAVTIDTLPKPRQASYHEYPSRTLRFMRIVMISISDTAQAHFRKLLEKQPDGTNIRVFVVNPGTQNAECGVSYCPPDAVDPEDQHLPFSGFDCLVDPLSAPYLVDATIDFVTDQMGSQLTLKAPNAKMRKVADDAPLADRIEYVLMSEVNPMLAGHGGKVTLVELTEDKLAILQFGGGCNGCSMVDYTLKEGIEKQLLEKFPGELNGVKDATEHQRGDHSYY